MRRCFSSKPVRGSGFALPVTIVIIVVILTLAIALIYQALSTRSVTGRGEKQRAQENTGEIVGGLMQQVFASGKTPDPVSAAKLGLKGPLPQPGGAVVPFSGTIGEIAFSGSFNGGDGPWSTYQPVPEKVDPKYDNFYGGKIPCYDPKKLPVPPQHSLIYVKTQAPKEAPRCYYYMFSNMAPYGALAPRGSIELRGATSTVNPWFDQSKLDVSGRKVYLGAGKKITVRGKLQGKALSGQPAASSPVSLGDSESGEIDPDELEEIEKILKQLEGDLEKQMNELVEAIIARALSEGIEGLATAIATASATMKIGSFSGAVVDCGGFSFDLAKKKMIWNSALFIKKKKALSIPLNIEVRGDLILQDDALLATTGSLTVHGRLFLGQRSVVYADNDLTVRGRVNVHYSPKVDLKEIGIDPSTVPEELKPYLPYLGIESMIAARKDVVLGAGVRHLKFKPQRKARAFPFKALANPFDKFDKDGNITAVWSSFENAVSNAFNPLQLLANRLSPFISDNIDVKKEDEDTETPGIAIYSKKGSVTIVDHGPDASLAGLIFCKEDIVLEFVPEEPNVFYGVLISMNGDIKAFKTMLRYYPYFAHGTFPIDPEETRYVNFSMPHLVSSGEYRK
jgi:hypothetical protein